MGIWIDSMTMIQLGPPIVAFRGIWLEQKCASPKEQYFQHCTHQRWVSSLSPVLFWRVRPVAGWGGRNGMQRHAVLSDELKLERCPKDRTRNPSGEQKYSKASESFRTLQGFFVRTFREFTDFWSWDDLFVCLADAVLWFVFLVAIQRFLCFAALFTGHWAQIKAAEVLSEASAAKQFRHLSRLCDKVLTTRARYSRTCQSIQD